MNRLCRAACHWQDKMKQQKLLVSKADSVSSPCSVMKVNIYSTAYHNSSDHEVISSLSSSCLHHSAVMGDLLAGSGPFLFPCTIEYSLISAAVLYMMWKNVKEEHEHYKTSNRRNKISFRMHIPIKRDEQEVARNQVIETHFKHHPLTNEHLPFSTQWTAPMPTMASSPGSLSWCSRSFLSLCSSS